jgi:hypothetical protein
MPVLVLCWTLHNVYVQMSAIRRVVAIAPIGVTATHGASAATATAGMANFAARRCVNQLPHATTTSIAIHPANGIEWDNEHLTLGQIQIIQIICMISA